MDHCSNPTNLHEAFSSWVDSQAFGQCAAIFNFIFLLVISVSWQLWTFLLNVAFPQRWCTFIFRLLDAWIGSLSELQQPNENFLLQLVLVLIILFIHSRPYKLTNVPSAPHENRGWCDSLHREGIITVWDIQRGCELHKCTCYIHTGRWPQRVSSSHALFWPEFWCTYHLS